MNRRPTPPAAATIPAVPAADYGRYLPLALLALAAFLAPIAGGNVLMDVWPLSPDTPLITALLGGREMPLLSHALIALFLAGSIVAAIWRNKVLQLPSGIVLGFFSAFGVFLFLSLFRTDFRAVSLVVLLEWLLCMAAFIAACAVAGHGIGPKVLLGAVAGGCAIVAAIGLREYVFQPDPHWRVFSTWVNPNVLAAMLSFGLFAALGLASTLKGPAALAAGAGATVIGATVLTTQSRGATIALLSGMAWFILSIGFQKGAVKEKGSALVKTAACLVAAFLLYMLSFSAISRSAGPGAGPTNGALSRVSGPANQAKEQSSAFRLLLYKGCISMASRDAGGTGLGTYRFEGSRTGLTMPTQFAHNSYLQLAVETGWFALPCLLVFVVACGLSALRGSRRMPFASSPLRAAVWAALVASAVHNVFDSDLYQFGLGFTFFLFLGIALQIAADGLSPEFIPRTGRFLAGFGTLVLVVGLAYMGLARMKASQALGLFADAQAKAAGGDTGAAAEELENARILTSGARDSVPFDGEFWYQSAYFSRTRSDRLQMLQVAAELSPSPKYCRALAREQLATGKVYEAIASLGKALERDPNNPAALLMLAQARARAGDEPRAVEAARRLIAIEQTPYFQVRALPEVIPTETYSAREFLAAREADPAKKADLLLAAMEGRLAYLRITFPKVQQMAKAGGDAFAGETLESAVEKLKQGVADAQQLKVLYDKLGRPSRARAAAEAAAQIQSALDAGGGSSR